MFGTSSSFGSKPSSLFGNTSNTTTTNQATEDIAVTFLHFFRKQFIKSSEYFLIIGCFLQYQLRKLAGVVGLQGLVDNRFSKNRSLSESTKRRKCNSYHQTSVFEIPCRKKPSLLSQILPVGRKSVNLLFFSEDGLNRIKLVLKGFVAISQLFVILYSPRFPCDILI
uniref:Uncharacterized protein n=1 Tax=Heterorhabditis bacteriophora TaxID=37862 RepID=A0A1I7X3S1_HETBA